MKSLFEPAIARQITERLENLTSGSKREWGTMNPAQAVAHCANGLELALGERRPPRMLFGRLAGWLIKPLALGNDQPMRRSSPTVPGIEVEDDRNLFVEKKRIFILINRLASGGPDVCTTHPHSFFGKLTPQEWGVLMYKHLDHHLRQFGE